jgi:hypothetical protein
MKLEDEIRKHMERIDARLDGTFGESEVTAMLLQAKSTAFVALAAIHHEEFTICVSAREDGEDDDNES